MLRMSAATKPRFVRAGFHRAGETNRLIKLVATAADHRVMRYEVEWIDPDSGVYHSRFFDDHDEAYARFLEIPASAFPVLRDRLDNTVLEPKSTQ